MVRCSLVGQAGYDEDRGYAVTGAVGHGSQHMDKRTTQLGGSNEIACLLYLGETATHVQSSGAKKHG